MRIFPPPIEITDNEGFTPDKDIFSRANFGSGLANLMAKVEDPMVLVLDAPWGSGKTTFVKMWAGYLRQLGHPVIYFDAFANDYVDSAFLAIAGEVVSLSESAKSAKKPLHKKFLDKAARVGEVFLQSGVKIGVKAATLGALDVSDLGALKTVATDIGTEVSTKTGDYIKSLLVQRSQGRGALESFREALTELIDSLSPIAETEGDSTRRPLIFIIDELDRCRPPFALELLEKVKHVFSVRSVHFVLVTHLSQLEGSVRFNYGPDIDAPTYLQKFYNLVVQLPTEGASRHERTTPRYISYLGTTFSLNSDDLDLVRHVAEAQDLSLRTIERIVTYVALAKAFTPKNYLWLDPIVVGLCIMKVLNAELLRRAKSGTLTIDDVRTVLAIGKWRDDASGDDWTMQWWTYCLAKTEAEHPDIDWKALRSSLARYTIRERKDIIRVMATHLDRLELPKAS